MLTSSSSQQQQIAPAFRFAPTIVVVLPFHPLMVTKSDLDKKLTAALSAAEKELLSRYSRDEALPVIERLRKCIRSLNYYTHKRTIAIFISSVMEKVFYLSMEVEPRIVVDQPFEMRQLISCKKQKKEYLTLILGAQRSKLFIGKGDNLVLLKSNAPSQVSGGKKEGFKKQVSNTTSEQFLRQMDRELSILLQAYPLPVFVLSEPEIWNQFRNVTTNASWLVDHIPGNCTDFTLQQLKETVVPVVAQWNQVKQQFLLNQSTEAYKMHQCAAGLEQVYSMAKSGKGKLLVIENDFIAATEQTKGKERNIRQAASFGNRFYIHDAVDDVIEKVLENGGEVEFVEAGVLNNYGHIVLV
jgi:hypothetical protein